MDLGIKGKTAVITGAGQGIGKACAMGFAKEGVNVCICDINIKKAEEVAQLAREMGVKAVAVKADVSNEAEVKVMFETVKKELKSVDILINNAALSIKTPFDEITAEEFNRTMSVNLLGTFLCSKYAFEEMRNNRWGRIVNLSSMSGRFGANKAGLHYATTKGGIISMTMTQAKKMGPYNVTSNCVAPGRIDTALTRVLPEDVKQEILKQIPMGRFGTTEEVANIIIFLASKPAAYVTGTCVDILGGYIA